jgi:hypothetical protein
MRATERGLDLAIVTSSGPEWVCEQPSRYFSHSRVGTKSFHRVAGPPRFGTATATFVQAAPRCCLVDARSSVIATSDPPLLAPRELTEIAS